MLQFRLLPLILFPEKNRGKNVPHSVNNYIFTQRPQLAILLGMKVPINELIHVDNYFYFSEISESKVACVYSCNVVSINGDPNKGSLPDTVERRGSMFRLFFFLCTR